MAKARRRWGDEENIGGKRATWASERRQREGKVKEKRER